MRVKLFRVTFDRCVVSVHEEKKGCSVGCVTVCFYLRHEEMELHTLSSFTTYFCFVLSVYLKDTPPEIW